MRQAFIEQQLRQALANGELDLCYQPQYNNLLGKIESFEALLRWENPVLGAVEPSLLIKVAEVTGLIVPIGEWVLRTACQFIRRIHREGLPDCRIAVNVSIVQLMQEDFVEQVLTILHETGLASGFLELELTESLPMGSFEIGAAKLQILKAWDVRVALDDFGTGYASLSILNNLKIDIIKIDKSFIDGIPKRQESMVLTKGIIDIGRQLGLKVIAEGVEQRVQVKYLSQWGCHSIQGYFYWKPMTGEDAVNIVKTYCSNRFVENSCLKIYLR